MNKDEVDWEGVAGLMANLLCAAALNDNLALAQPMSVEVAPPTSSNLVLPNPSPKYRGRAPSRTMFPPLTRTITRNHSPAERAVA